MALFNFFSKKNTKPDKASDVREAFVEDVEKAIVLVDKHYQLDDKELLQLYLDNNISYESAVAIWFFLPDAFARKLLPNVKWRDSYGIVEKDKTITKKRYEETPTYKLICAVTNTYFQNPDKDTVWRIAGRAAAIHAMNDLLLKNPENIPEDIILTENYYIRP